MPEIREYSPDDKNRVREICLRTANDSYEFTTVEDYPGKDYLLNLYCDYYIECEPENCFVLADENGAAVGYVMCAESQRSYSRSFMKIYRKRMDGCSPSERINGVAEVLLHGAFAAKHPAHLHIDILREYRAGGNGTAMMKRLLSHLREKGVAGVHLVVSEGNKGAIRFYERNGFKTLLKFGKGRVMGQRL